MRKRKPIAETLSTATGSVGAEHASVVADLVAGFELSKSFGRRRVEVNLAFHDLKSLACLN